MERSKESYCNNCGNYGHSYSNCRHPILSYGIILYSMDEDTSKIIMVERKDSLSYIEFLRGKYKSIFDIEYIELLFSRFSKHELIKIKGQDFDTLWKGLWIHTESINQRIKKEYKKSKENFNKLKKGFLKGSQEINIDKLVDKVKIPYDYNECEIPKGRRKLYENNRDCAMREFNEETNIKSNDYSLYKNVIPITEEYIGINGVRYKHVYYIGSIDKRCDLYIYKNNKDQYTEIKNIKWYTREECIHNIRNYDKPKKKVITDFFNYLESYQKVVTIE